MPLEAKAAIRTLAIALLIMAPIGLFYILIGPGFEISITQSWGGVTYETTEIKTVIAINNPTLFARWLKKIEFDLYINDLKITSEVNETNMEVKPLGKTEIQLTSFLNNSRIPDLWITYLHKDNTFEVRLNGNVTFRSMTREIVCPIGYETAVHTNLLDLLKIQEPNIRVGPYALMSKNLTSTWGKVSSIQTEINNDIVIHNPNEYPVGITAINYTIEMNGIKMGEGIVYNLTVLGAKKDDNLSFTSILNNAMLYQWWATHVRNDQITRITLNLYGKAEVSGVQYTFPIIEAAAGASIRILGATVSYGYYLPIL